jgi:hypothetical protein
MNQKATGLTSLAFVSSQIFVTWKVFEQVEILAVQHKISRFTNGTRTHFYVDQITSELRGTSRKEEENCFTTM